MAEYIEREALLKRLKFKAETDTTYHHLKQRGLESAMAQVRKAPAAEPTDKPWKVAMIVTVRVFRGHCSWYQNYESMEAARRALLDWKGYG